MTTLTLAKLAEIEAAAAKATPGPWKAGTYYITGSPKIYSPYVAKSTLDDDRNYIALCDPATVAALCRVARAAVDLLADGEAPFSDLDNAVRAAGLLE